MKMALGYNKTRWIYEKHRRYFYKGKNLKKHLFSQSLYLCLPLVNCCIFDSLEVEITTFLGLGLDNDLEKVKSLGRDQRI